MYTCNGSPKGCERERFGHCNYCDEKDSEPEYPYVRPLPVLAVAGDSLRLPFVVVYRDGDNLRLSMSRRLPPKARSRMEISRPEAAMIIRALADALVASPNGSPAES